MGPGYLVLDVDIWLVIVREIGEEDSDSLHLAHGGEDEGGEEGEVGQSWGRRSVGGGGKAGGTCGAEEEGFWTPGGVAELWGGRLRTGAGGRHSPVRDWTRKKAFSVMPRM